MTCGLWALSGRAPLSQSPRFSPVFTRGCPPAAVGLEGRVRFFHVLTDLVCLLSIPSGLASVIFFSTRFTTFFPQSFNSFQIQRGDVGKKIAKFENENSLIFRMQSRLWNWFILVTIGLREVWCCSWFIHNKLIFASVSYSLK